MCKRGQHLTAARVPLRIIDVLEAIEIHERVERLMKLGAACSKAPSAWRLVKTELDDKTGKLAYSLDRDKLQKVRRREGRNLLRTNLIDDDPAKLWQHYIQLVAVEEAFKTLKGDLAICPVFHHDDERIEARIFVPSLA